MTRYPYHGIKQLHSLDKDRFYFITQIMKDGGNAKLVILKSQRSV